MSLSSKFSQSLISARAEQTMIALVERSIKRYGAVGCSLAFLFFKSRL